MSLVKVVVADDNPVVRSGLVSLLEATGVARVLAEAADGRRAIELTELHRPDLVLLDVRMPLLDGVTAVQTLSKITKVLMLTYTDDPEVIRAAVRGGASGYLVHGTFGVDELAAAVRDAAAGTGNPLSQVAITALMDAVKEPAKPGPRNGDRDKYGLSAREVEVMDLIAQGRANREIAGALFLTEKTVKNHVNRIFAKLAVENRAAAIARWLGTAVGDR
ncbi:response regulator transcription factor [Actinomadura kijaniata]|uniref:DNA-binding NarL/FixJ family response regulator n=1 Tax=Actinomadura namibiensis TaxID=182080 RepID=A0A7W3QIS2_ACTNM|nr:response regulator transcription factor [Actinomadura namibiensis]MBA8948552.1 DNA-binding NarL/FixJ family response regulator [Actinomadura namibiensis]